MKEGIRHNNHIIPRFYLKGFTDSVDTKFIWVYTKGKSYNPGKQNVDIYSPCLTSTRAAGAQFDFYIYQHLEGNEVDDLHEKQLEKIEGYSQPILQKIRERRLISDIEKLSFSEYIMLLVKRVPYQRNDPNNNVMKAAGESFIDLEKKLNSFLEKNKKDEVRYKKLMASKKELERLKTFYYKNPEKVRQHLYNQSLTQTSLLQVRVLSSMNWTFLINESRSPFLTSDNPVYYDRVVGVNQSDVSFPISSNIALVCSWKNEPYAFIKATEEKIRRINRRTCKLSTNHLFASINEEWITKMANKSRYEIGKRV